MAQVRTPMHKIRRIIEFHSVNGLSDRQISHLTKVSRPTVAQYLVNFQASHMDLDTFRNLSDTEALTILTMGRHQTDPTLLAAIAFFPEMNIELRKVGVTRQLLWTEYHSQQPDGFMYSQFCHYFKVWQGTQANKLSMHQEHQAGESAYLDWAGKLPLCITNPDTGIQTKVEFFVGILGASEYTYAEACPNQELRHWITACQHALEYFEGVPAALTPDAYKGAVTTACRYDPMTNRTFQDFADHYHTIVMPARPYKPKDKALVEGMVRILYTRLFAPLRNRTFHSINELNEALWQLLEVHNKTKFQRLEVTRHDLWQSVDKPALKPLPTEAFEYRQYKVQKVPNTYHIRISADDHYYSVPWRCFGKEVTVVATIRTVEVYHDNQRVAFHRRLHARGWSTIAEHMPDHHRFVASWSPQRITDWAAAAGPSVGLVCAMIMRRYQFPEHGFRHCIGIINLQDKWSKERLERACRLALERESPGYRAIKTILERNEDKVISATITPQALIIEHENIRGQAAYS